MGVPCVCVLLILKLQKTVFRRKPSKERRVKMSEDSSSLIAKFKKQLQVLAG
jgi:hypothetical protein